MREEVVGCKDASSARVLSARLKNGVGCSAALAKPKRAQRALLGIMPIHVDDAKISATQAVAKEPFSLIDKDENVNLSKIEKQELDTLAEL